MPITPAITMDGELIGLTVVFTPSTLDGYDNPPHRPGDVHLGSDDSAWVYVFAATTMNQYDCVSIDANSNASQMTSALAASAVTRVGFCQVAGGIPAGSYGWVALYGVNLKLNMASGSAAGSAHYTTAVAGVLGTTASGQTQIYGVVATAAPGGSQAPVPIVAAYPRTMN